MIKNKKALWVVKKIQVLRKTGIFKHLFQLLFQLFGIMLFKRGKKSFFELRLLQ